MRPNRVRRQPPRFADGGLTSARDVGLTVIVTVTVTATATGIVTVPLTATAIVTVTVTGTADPPPLDPAGSLRQRGPESDRPGVPVEFGYGERPGEGRRPWPVGIVVDRHDGRSATRTHERYGVGGYIETAERRSNPVRGPIGRLGVGTDQEAFDSR